MLKALIDIKILTNIKVIRRITLFLFGGIYSVSGLLEETRFSNLLH